MAQKGPRLDACCILTSTAAKFLTLTRCSHSSLTLSNVHAFADEITTWRRMLPEELLSERVQSWSSANVWIIILLSLGYRLDCVFYRTARDHFSQSGDRDTVAWCKQQLARCVFELDTLINRAIVHNLVRLAPASMYGLSLPLHSDSTDARILSCMCL